MTYYDDFEMDCGCRMHCRCGKNDGGSNLRQLEQRLAEAHRRNGTLAAENARLEAELAWRRPAPEKAA